MSGYEEENTALLKRLARVEGQVRGIARMMEEAIERLVRSVSTHTHPAGGVATDAAPPHNPGRDRGG